MGTSRQKESLLKESILQWLNTQRGCIATTYYSGGIFDPVRKIYRKPNSKFVFNGMPDIIGSWGGRPMAIEVKTEIGRVSPEQKFMIERLKTLGWISFVARSIDDVINYLKENTPNKTKCPACGY